MHSKVCELEQRLHEVEAQRMTDLQTLHEALHQREQELAAVVASQAMSQQQDDDLKQVTTGVMGCATVIRILALAQHTWLTAFAVSAKEAATHALDTVANSSAQCYFGTPKAMLCSLRNLKINEWKSQMQLYAMSMSKL